jgi:hypothetical protein
MKITSAVRSTTGRLLESEGLASSTVGRDDIPSEVLVAGTPPVPTIIPGNGELGVDPETNIIVAFTEPIQLLSLGELADGSLPPLSAAIQVLFGPSTARVEVPFHIRPFSVYDLSRYELVLLYAFPGSNQAATADCGAFGTVDVRVNSGQFEDLRGNTNTLSPSTFFRTREGPGLVNAPVTPDTIYIGRGGNNQGISVIDLNGFGASTGNPAYDRLDPIVEGRSNYPNNPNVSVQGSLMIPPLSPGTCTFNGGSAGVFTLTKDSSLSDLVARAPLLESVGDMALGHALDNTFNDSSPFGCQSGGGNLCATTGLKQVRLSAGGPNSLAPSTTSALPTKTVFGVENMVSWAPHPNPPPLTFPPTCLSPLINGLEPTSVLTVPSNLLVSGPNVFGNPALKRPATNLVATDQNAFFQGPSPPRTPCVTIIGLPAYFGLRQQIGHFLYVVDRSAGEVVVFNSNRFTVIDRIRLPDPTSLAMSPNLDLLAVTNERADQVSFIDTDPASSTFHQVIRTVTVGAGPTGIAWEPGNEDIFVCNRSEGTVSVISAFTLRVRKTLRNQLSAPIEVAITPRQLGFGFMRGVYFAYILNQNGTVAIFESGPDGINGWGFDDVIGSLPFTFNRPKTIQPDMTRLNSGVWIVHEDRLTPEGLPTFETGGALTNVGISSATQGIIPLSLSGGGLNPQLRNMEFGIFGSIGEGVNGLSGKAVDIALDNQINLTALTNFTTQYSAGTPLSVNGKSILRFSSPNFIPASAPQFVFLAVPNPGVVDVFELSTGTLQRFDTNVFHAGIQSIPASNASILVDYFRQ